MSRSFQIFAYVLIIIIGGLMIIFKDGHIEVVCIACNGFIINLFGIVAILTGIAGLVGTVSSRKEVAGGR